MMVAEENGVSIITSNLQGDPLVVEEDNKHPTPVQL
jgi:hypothetical protein